jgi:VWFA-related protein
MRENHVNYQEIFSLLLRILLAMGIAVGTGSYAEKPWAAESGEKPAQDEKAFKVSVDLVNVLCTVTDRSQRFITNLKKEDFKIYEDGHLQELRNFSRETDLPLSIALLIDTSESVSSQLRSEQEAAVRFFKTVLKEKDRALLAEFDSSVTLLQDFTNDVAKLEKELRTLRAGGGTSLYDAVQLVCEQKFLQAKGRKTIVIISDGHDTTSRASLENALEMAERAEVTIFSISTNKPGFWGTGGGKSGDKVLTKLAGDTGGRMLSIVRQDDLDKAFLQISEELRSQYNLGFISSNPARDSRYRNLTVKLSDRSLRVRHRKGYYAPGGSS